MRAGVFVFFVSEELNTSEGHKSGVVNKRGLNKVERRIIYDKYHVNFTRDVLVQSKDV